MSLVCCYPPSTHAVVGDIILVALILVLAIKLHVSFPESMKGLLFYIQTAYYTTEYFPISFWNIRKYVSNTASCNTLYLETVCFQMLFLSSAIGLYFPWDFCLFPSMSPLVSFAPKFTPAAIATLGSTIAIITIYVTRYISYKPLSYQISTDFFPMHKVT